MRVLLIATTIVALVAVHGAILYFFSEHLAASVTVVLAAVGLLMLKHLGLLGALFARLRRRR